MKWHSVGVVLASLDCCAAWAQPSAAPAFDRNPLHPVPVVIYGRVSLGLARPDPFDSGTALRSTRVAALEPARLGLRAAETLDVGLLAHLNLEHGFNASSGEASSQRSFWNRRATVGLEMRDKGRLDLGLADQPAWLLVLRADPWGGNTPASPGRRLYPQPMDPQSAACAAGPCEPLPARSAGALSYATPAHWDWQLRAQLGRPGPAAVSTHRGGFSLAWDRKPWLAGIGWQAWTDGSHAAPLVLVHDAGDWSLGTAVTRGRVDRQRYRNLFIGAGGPVFAKGEPWRQEWRLGLDRFDPDNATAQWKLSAGYRYRLSRRVALLADGALLAQGGGSTHVIWGLGLSYTFERDLRFPQVPRGGS